MTNTMLSRLTYLLGVIFLGVLTGCSQVDDYILGKDNTPKPMALTKLDKNIPAKTHWSVRVSPKNASTAYSPIVSSGVVYTAMSQGLVAANRAKDGQSIWTTPLPWHISSPLTVDGHYVAVGAGSHVVLINSLNGQRLWHYRVSGAVLAAPLMMRDKLIVKTIDGRLYAFILSTGKLAWIADHGAPSLILRASSSPVLLSRDTILVAYADGKIAAVSFDTGEILWQRSVAYPSGPSDIERLVDIDTDPIVHNDTVYLATYQGYVGSLSLKTGQFIWRKPASTYHNVAWSNHALYLVDVQDRIKAYALNDGNVMWHTSTLKARGLTAPVLLGNYIIVGDKAGFLHVLSTREGKMLGRIAMQGAVNHAPSISNGRIFVLTANGQLTCLSVS